MESIVHSPVRRDPQWGIPKRPVCDSPSLAEGFLAQCESRQLSSYLHTPHITVPDKSLRWVSSTRVFGFGRTSRRNRGHRTRHPGWTQNMLWQVLLTWKPGKLIYHSRSSQGVARDGPKSLENRALPQGTGKNESPGGGLGKSEPGVKPGELARLEAVVSRLEVEGGGGRGNNSRAIQVYPFIILLLKMKMNHLRGSAKKNSSFVKCLREGGGKN